MKLFMVKCTASDNYTFFVDYYELVVASDEDQVRKIWIEDKRDVEDIRG